MRTRILIACLLTSMIAVTAQRSPAVASLQDYQAAEEFQAQDQAGTVPVTVAAVPAQDRGIAVVTCAGRRTCTLSETNGVPTTIRNPVNTGNGSLTLRCVTSSGSTVGSAFTFNDNGALASFSCPASAVRIQFECARVGCSMSFVP